MKIRKPFESYDFEDEEACLEHYGIKGMKWGKRKNANDYAREAREYEFFRSNAVRDATDAEDTAKSLKWRAREAAKTANEYGARARESEGLARRNLKNGNIEQARKVKQDAIQARYDQARYVELAKKDLAEISEYKAKAAASKAKSATYAAKFQGAEQAMHAAKAAEASEKRKKEKRKQAIKSFFGKPGSLFKVNFKK